MKRKKNKKAWDALKEKYADYLIQAGWFEESKYDNGTPIGGIAAVQNYGAVINQSVTEKQRNFLRLLGIYLRKTTQTLHIVIPATHFMEDCQNKNKEKWRKLIKDAWTSVFLGNIEPDKAMEQIAFAIEGDIRKAIKDVEGPPLSPLTLEGKKRGYKDQKTTGNLGKRLEGTGQMALSVSHKVTKK